jgi:hypothetical protein
LKKVFVAKDPTEAYFVAGLLEAESIQAVVRGETLFGLRGELPMTPDTCPSVWVLEDTEVEKARALVMEFEKGGAAEEARRAPLHCPRCGETIKSQFTQCWQCGNVRPSDP